MNLGNRSTVIGKFLGAALLLLLAGLAQAQGIAAGSGIATSTHDPRIWDFFAVEQQVCVMCHAPHNTSTAGPLWNHALSVASYTMYNSPTMNAVVGASPGPVSKLCLSCHDGTVGILDYGGATGGMSLFDAYGCNDCFGVLGTNLSNDHPIGITYDAALAAADGALANPATTDVTIGATKTKTGKIAALLLTAGKVECTSCHDVHNKYTVTNTGNRGLIKVTLVGSALCLTCHTK